jgi:4-amino-4-deoxy-L-arabinose transferase-like glycosyltransferase
MRKKVQLRAALPKITLITILIIGAFLRFYKLDWGEGFFFHPDEYHIAIAVNNISFPNNLNPKLFSYGSLTVYLIFIIKNLFASSVSPFLIGRFISASFSTLTILLTYIISKKLFKRDIYSLMASLLVATTPGLIQQAHFATPESTLTFFMTLTVYLWLLSKDAHKFRYILLSGVTLGLAVATKIIAVTLAPIVTVPIVYKLKISSKKIILAISMLLTFLLVSCGAFFCTFPYSILDKKNFLSTTKYESSLAEGKIPIFYTRQFIKTIPLVFQFEKVLPYALGPSLIIIGSLGIIIALTNLVIKFFLRDKNTGAYTILILLLGFLAYFIPNSFFFVKWTRYMAPALPYFSVFGVYLIYEIDHIYGKNKLVKGIILTAAAAGIVIHLIWTLMFFSIYLNHDVRITADGWINTNIPQGAYILTESGNTYEVPFTGFYKKNSFDFYNLDQDITLQKQLVLNLENTDYFIIQSRRVFFNQPRLPEEFPISSKFYNNLLGGNLGFSEIKEFNSLPQLTINHYPLTINDEAAEETWSVFDHPVIRVYKKVKYYPQEYYAKILGI